MYKHTWWRAISTWNTMNSETYWNLANNNYAVAIQGDHYKRHDLKMLQLFHFLLDFNQTFLRCSSIYAKICVEGFSTIFWKIVHSLNGQTHVQNVRHHAAGRLECVAESYPQLVCTPLSGLFWFLLVFSFRIVPEVLNFKTHL